MTTSKLKDMLNGIYYESGTGECYTGNSFTPAIKNTCDFNLGTDLPKGLDETAKNMIAKEVIWNIAGSKTNDDVTLKMFYERERGTNTGFAKELHYWDSTTGNYKSECGGTDWLKPNNGYLWTLSSYSSNTYLAFVVYSNGPVYTSYTVRDASGIWPSLYLKSSVKIIENPQSDLEYGTISNPFVLEA